MSETNERKLEKLEKQYEKLTHIMTSLYKKHVDPSLKTMETQYHEDRMLLEESIDAANKELSLLTSRRDKLMSDYKKLKNLDIKKMISDTRERLIRSKETKNRYTRNLKILMHRRDQIRYKISRLTHGRKLPQETDSPTLSVSVSPPRKRSSTRKRRSRSRSRSSSKTLKRQ